MSILGSTSFILTVNQQLAERILRCRERAVILASEISSMKLVFRKFMYGNRWFLCSDESSLLGSCIVGSVVVDTSQDGDQLHTSDPYTYPCPIPCTIKLTEEGLPCISTDSRDGWADLQRAAEGRGPMATNPPITFRLTCPGFGSNRGIWNISVSDASEDSVPFCLTSREGSDAGV